MTVNERILLRRPRLYQSRSAIEEEEGNKSTPAGNSASLMVNFSIQ